VWRVRVVAEVPVLPVEPEPDPATRASDGVPEPETLPLDDVPDPEPV
jgi:hypothetical protein